MKIHKKLFSITGSLLLFSTSFSGIPTAVSANSTEPHYVEPTYKSPINIALTNGNHNQFLTPNQNFTLSASYSIAEARNFVLVPGAYSVAMSGSTVTLSQNGKTIFSTSGSLTIFPIVYGFGSVLKLSSNNRNYLGSMQFQSGRVINKLPLEHYLYGVVAHEIGESSHAESQKVQAVSARTFAARRANMVIQDNTLHQVYRGYNPAHVRSIKAINDTRGQLMKQGSTIIETFFSSSNGGNTLSVANSWGAAGSQLPYLTRKTDTFDTAHNWNFSLREQQIDLTKLTVSTPLSWWSTTNEIDHTHPQLIGLKKWMIGKSSGPVNANFKITKLNVEFTTPENTTIGYGTHLNGKIIVDYIFLNTQNELVSSTYTMAERTYNFYQHKVFGSIGSFSAIRSPNVKSAKTTNGIITISGSGWGHGIGMSQNGAMSRAQAGHSYTSILSFYYDGVTITPTEAGEVFTNHSPVLSAPTSPPVVTEPTVPEEEDNNDYDIHIIISGDTLWSLSVKYKTTVAHLQTINGFSSSTTLSVGYHLKIPKQPGTTPAPEPDPLPEPEIETLTLTSVSGLYTSTNRTTRLAIIPSGTKFNVLEKDNDFTKVKYNGTEGWVKNGINTLRGYFNNSFGLFDNPEFSEPRTVLGKQGVHVISERADGWRYIETYLGNKWAKDGVIGTLSIESISGLYSVPESTERISVLEASSKYWLLERGSTGWNKILYNNLPYWTKENILSYSSTLTKQSGLFSSPTVNSQYFGVVEPGPIFVVEEGTSGWKKIRIDSLDYWTKDGVLKDYTIQEYTGLYSNPNIDSRTNLLKPNSKVYLLNPLTTSWNEVLFNGQKIWINLGISLDTHHFDSLTGLFDEPSTRVPRVGSIQNKTVVVVNKNTDGWLLIETHLGEKWAKEGYYDQLLTPIVTKSASALFKEKNRLDIILTVPAGMQLDSMEQGADGWHKIQYGNTIAWYKDGEINRRVYLKHTSGLFKTPNPTVSRIASINEQFVVVLSETPDGWLKIHTWLGEMWVKDGVMQHQEVIKLNSPSGLYTEPNSIQRIALVSAGREFNVIQKQNDWYLIETYEGSLWVKDGYKTNRLYLSERSGLFTSQGGLNNPVSVIDPQYIIVLDSGTDGWLKIQTWVGEMWVKSGVVKSTSPVPYRTFLSTYSGMFSEPNGRLISYVSPQGVSVTEIGPDGWLKIDTWLGPLWVKNGVTKPDSPFTFRVTTLTGIYESPNGKRISSITTQNVTVVDVAPGGWMKINSWLGQRWIKDGFMQ